MNPSSLTSFARARVLVVGNFIFDLYWRRQPSSISPEASVSAVRVARAEPRESVTANVVANMARLGASVRLIASSGEQDSAIEPIQLFRSHGVGEAPLAAPGACTITTWPVMAYGQQVIPLDFAQDPLATHYGTLVQRFTRELKGAQVVLFSDNARGTSSDILPLIKAARAAGKWAVADPTGADFERYRGASIITPKLGDFEAVMGRCGDHDQLVTLARQLANKLDLCAVLVTHSEKGMSLVPRQGAALHLPTVCQRDCDVTGARDMLIATLVYSLSTGCELQQAVQLADSAAAAVVSRLGASPLNWNQLQAAVDSAARGHDKRRWACVKGGAAPQHAIIGNKAELVIWRAAARARGERVVMTNGCFDLLHPGHLDYLARARALGDRLVVAVNEDASVQRLKGIARPVNPLAVRQQMLGGLAAVDYVVSFAQDTPESLYAAVLPDVLVKGGDYCAEDVVGAAPVRAAGGSVIILPFVEGYSSTNLIHRIQNLPKG
jgi:D-beta-D-heptose 7-phosphate kinase/D-beta-D-heptose 1-phosphate adenosyltransferase